MCWKGDTRQSKTSQKVCNSWLQIRMHCRQLIALAVHALHQQAEQQQDADADPQQALAFLTCVLANLGRAQK